MTAKKSETKTDATDEAELARAAAEREKQARIKSEQLLTARVLASLDTLPEGYRIPEHYRITFDEVFHDVLNRAGEVVSTTIAYSPLLVVKVLEDPDGEQMVELAWRDGTRWISRTVPRAAIRSGRKLVTALGNANQAVLESDAKAVERYLARLEAVNRGVIERVRIARHLGWQPDGTFLPGLTPEQRIEPAFREQQAALAAHHPAGNLQGWQAGIARMAPYPTAQAALYAGLAAPLLRLLRLRSFTVDFATVSTRGKTKAAMAALSPWADPSAEAGAMSGWRTSIYSVELRANLVRGLPIVLDDTRTVKKPELVDEVLYLIHQDRGTPRGGDWANAPEWSTIIISTGERPALSFTTHQGASARLLTARNAPFGRGPTGGEDADAVSKAIEANYGVAGPAFAAKLTELLATTDDSGRSGLDRLRARHEELAAEHDSGNPVIRRRAPLIAVLRLAAELACAWGIVPLQVPDRATWSAVFDSDGAEDNRSEMALDVVREFVAARGEHLWRPRPRKNRARPGGDGFTGVQTQPGGDGWIGRHTIVNGQHTIALMPVQLRKALERSGIDLDAVIPGWREAGALVENPKDAKQPWTLFQRMPTGNPRQFVFAPGVITIAGDASGEQGGDQ